MCLCAHLCVWCVCVGEWYKAVAACIKARAAGLLLAFFWPPDACHCFKGKKEQGDEKERRTKMRRGGRARKGGGGCWGAATAVQIMSRSANSSSLIREREGTGEGLSQDRGPGSNTQPHTDICIHLVFLSGTYLHTDTISLFLSLTHTHRNTHTLAGIHTQMTLAHGAVRGQFRE